MASATGTESIAGRLIGKLTGFVERFRDIGEIRSLSEAETCSIAHDLRISPAELETLVARGPHGADELPKMLNAVGIDESVVLRREPGVLQDMRRVCALCVEKSRCNRELEAGTAAEHHRDYCANAYTIDTLGMKQQPDRTDLLLRGPCCC
ncbi:hypothetical protein I6F35_11055 [Bradyrhizobium sp. BRP22]|uniref:hypothetical protein n=1 Tax=Bradyrhizobium sp. BRP22 TaxID=2793821 RepID=UPI001CD749B6|nr:hypothetical protein [Bradyrhizobium sp. BRP22]MCA1453750.1 hypothetical protein [Bradyrhizobium sp. BRP22]